MSVGASGGTHPVNPVHPVNPATPGNRLGIPRPLAWGYAGVLLFMIGDGVETSYLSKYFGTDLGFSATGAGAIITVYGVTAAIASFLGAGLLSDRWGPRRVMAAGAAVWAVFHVLMLAVAVPSGSYWLVMVTYGLRGFGYPLFAYGFLSWIMAVASPHHRSKAVGWFWFCYSAGYPIIGSFLFAAVTPTLGFYRTLWFSLAVTVAGSLVVLLLLKERTGFSGLAPGRGARAELAGTFRLLVEKPKIGISLVIRLINTTPSFGMWVFMPFFVRDLGFGDGEWNTLLVVMMTANLGALLVFGVLGDNWSGRKTCALFGGVLGAVGCLLCSYLPAAAGHNFPVAAVAVAVYGAGLAGYVPLPAMMVAQAPGRRGQVMGVYTLGAGLSVAVGPLIGTLSYGSFGFRGLVWIYAALLLLNAVLCLCVTSPGDGLPAESGTGNGTGNGPETERNSTGVPTSG
ncbi:MFS transporter [Streptomyces morookaense]|uniref:MFS transporter n=1 Tax=Streptomyces morookaense TaxID=1970 RepID=A0A7Y7B8M9_STRMO|nr:MFS transporter [Streptomyces morookaense]NVK80959.1 MFS transporter [Streptomyces morookaense]GHF40826.1 MFS transporter [Streptomyces morookaense]